jgi:hypothetical protein
MDGPTFTGMVNVPRGGIKRAETFVSALNHSSDQAGLIPPPGRSIGCYHEYRIV